MAKTNIKPVSQGLTWLVQMLSLLSAKQICIPRDYRSQVLEVEDVLKNDVSGLVNSILDFAVSSANVNFSVESSNKTVSTKLNDWLQNMNSELRGKIPTGVNELAKQYYIERWKKSSFIVLRTIWEVRDGYKVPVKLWFVDGKDLVISDDTETKTIGTEVYGLRVNKKDILELPAGQEERIFVQKPFESWSADYPTPYLIKRGTYYNLKFIELLADKGANVVARALEYMLMMKKGDKDLAKLQNPEFIYSEKELREIKDNFQKLMDEMRSTNGTPTHVTNFDTQIEHLIPDYEKILQHAIYSPAERRILASLGFIEVVEGITTSRKDSVINPKVFQAEVQAGVNGFSELLKDILMTIIEENKSLKPKLMKSSIIQIRTSPIKTFLSEQAREFLRSQYDRGLLSKRTITELCSDVDFDAEVERRKEEQATGLDSKEYKYVLEPPMIQNINQEAGGNAPKDKLPPDKKGPEAKNFTAQNLKFETSKKNKHTHKVDVHIVTDEKGDLIISGETDEVDGHSHEIRNVRETEPASDGHTHKLKFDNLNMSVDVKTKILKLQNLHAQKIMLANINKDDIDETA